jgi:aminopeptidase N
MRILSILLLCLSWQLANAKPYEEGSSNESAESSIRNISDVSYDLTFNIPADRQAPVSGTVVINFILQEQAEVVLDFQGDLSGNCIINGKKRSVQVQDEHIILPMKPMRQGFNRVELQFVSRNMVLNRHDTYLYTSFKPSQAHMCFPCFDQPGMRARFTTQLNVPEGWKTMASDPRTPLPTYLYSFVAGKFQEKTREDAVHPLRALYMETDPAKVSQLDRIFDEASQALRWMEEYTGVISPFTEYGMVILPHYKSGGMAYPSAIQVSDRQAFLDYSPSVETQQRRQELMAHLTAHLWFGAVVSFEKPDEVWAKEVVAAFMASKIIRRQLVKSDLELNYLSTTLTDAVAIDRTKGSHSIMSSVDSQDELAVMSDKIMHDKAPAVMHILEQLTGVRKMQDGLRKFLIDNYMSHANWDKLLEALEQEASNEGVRLAAETWLNQKGMPLIHTTYQNGKLTVTQTDANGRPICWRQKFAIRVINELEDSRTLHVDMLQPTMTFNLPTAPSHIIPNYYGDGYGRFMLDAEYTKRLALRLIVTRDDVQRYALLQTLHDNYLAGRIPPSYFGELYRNMTKEKNPLAMQTCIDHMFKIAFDLPSSERHTLEQCIMDVIPENRRSECRQIIIRKMARNATSPAVVNQLYQIWQNHSDPLFNEHDYMEMAYRLAIMRPSEWQQIVATERQHLKSDQLRQEFDYVSRACTPDANRQQQLFNDLLRPEGRQHESWALHLLELLNADVREPYSNQYITASLNQLEQLEQTSDIFFVSGWLHSLLATHKSADARQRVGQFLQQHPNLRPQLRYKVQEAAWMLVK